VMDELWPEAEPDVAANQLHKAAHYARRRRVRPGRTPGRTPGRMQHRPSLLRGLPRQDRPRPHHLTQSN
jgi:hypothetical protein